MHTLNEKDVKKIQRNADLTFLEKLYVPEILRGIAVTSRHFFRNLIGFIIPPSGKKRSVFTIYYPEELAPIPQAYRGRPVLVEENGKERCVACGLCEAVCPARCISIIGGERSTFDRFPISFSIDMSKCVFCGFCEEVCPKEAILMSDEYNHLAKYDRNEMLFDKPKLLVPVEKLQKRIEFVRKAYAKWNY